MPRTGSAPRGPTSLCAYVERRTSWQSLFVAAIQQPTPSESYEGYETRSPFALVRDAQDTFKSPNKFRVNDAHLGRATQDDTGLVDNLPDSRKMRARVGHTCN